MKHPNLRVAYVAQHAFHHIESHLDKSPNEYIRWRFQFGEDRELAAKATRQMSEEDKAQLLKVITIENVKYQIEVFMGRRKAKRSFEYDVKFVGKQIDDNLWITREKLEDWGFEKLVQAYDDKMVKLDLILGCSRRCLSTPFDCGKRRKTLRRCWFRSRICFTLSNARFIWWTES